MNIIKLTNGGAMLIDERTVRSAEDVEGYCVAVNDKGLPVLISPRGYLVYTFEKGERPVGVLSLLAKVVREVKELDRVCDPQFFTDDRARKLIATANDSYFDGMIATANARAAKMKGEESLPYTSQFLMSQKTENYHSVMKHYNHKRFEGLVSKPKNK